MLPSTLHPFISNLHQEKSKGSWKLRKTENIPTVRKRWGILGHIPRNSSHSSSFVAFVSQNPELTSRRISCPSPLLFLTRPVLMVTDSISHKKSVDMYVYSRREQRREKSGGKCSRVKQRGVEMRRVNRTGEEQRRSIYPQLYVVVHVHSLCVSHERLILSL